MNDRALQASTWGIPLQRIVNDSIAYVEAHHLASYDLFDALASPVIDRATRNRTLVRRIAIQANRHLPLNIRPLIGMRPMVHTKTISDLLSSFSLLGDGSQLPNRDERARELFTLLLERRCPTSTGTGWGLNFPYATRFIDASATTPNLYNTVNAAHAIMDYFEAYGDPRAEGILRDIVTFLFGTLGIVRISEDSEWFRYYPGQRVPNFNVNATAASVFLRMNEIFRKEMVSPDHPRKLLRFLFDGQNPDGSWFYTPTPEGRWIDGYHSGFILDSLAFAFHVTDWEFVRVMFQKGSRFYLEEMFDGDGTPKMFHNRVLPIEAQNCAQAIQTLARLEMHAGLKTRELLKKALLRSIEALYDARGFFYYKKERFWRNKLQYFRWSQTPMILGLVYVLQLDSGETI